MNEDKAKLKQTLLINLSKGIANLFSETELFQSCANDLSALLSLNYFALATCYIDKSNQEILLKTYALSESPEAQNAISSVANKYALSAPELSQSFQNLLELNLPSSSDVINSTACLLPQGLIEQGTHSENVQVLPFYHKELLIGLMVFDTDKAIDWQSAYLEIYYLLLATFESKYYAQLNKIKLRTYQNVLDLMPQRVFWKNKESIYLGCNQAFANDASLKSPDEIIGISDFDIFPAEAELYRADDANTMQTKEHMIGAEEPQTHANGSTIWLRTSKRPVINDEDNVVGVVGTYDDISELKNTQQELSLAKEKLEERVSARTQELSASKDELEIAIADLRSAQNHLVESEKMAALGNLVAGVAHEINTPIGIAVTGASHLEEMTKSLKLMVESGAISRTKFNHNVDELIRGSNIILRNLERASELVKNFKMIAVDQSKDDYREINVYQYLHDVISAMTPRINKKNINIHLNGERSYSISTYPGAIAQIMTNFVENALNHAFQYQQEGEIDIRFESAAGHLKLYFKDNGIGISSDKLDKIFEPFYTTKRGEGGSGLGLSIIYNIITQRLGGSVVCQSVEREWTEFIISLPDKALESA